MTQRPISNMRSRENRQAPRCRYSAFFQLSLLINGAMIQAIGIGIPIALSASELVEGRSDVSVSRPASAIVLSPNPTPSLGQLGAYYFETGNQSQIWINLEPQGLEPGPNPIRLNVTVAFTGRRLDRAPDGVDVRAQSVDIAFPMRIRQPILRFQLGGGIEMDLATPGKAFQFISSCGECPLDTVIVHITFDALRQVAESSTVGIKALGFTARLKPADILSLRKFIDVVSDGVQIR